MAGTKEDGPKATLSREQRRETAQWHRKRRRTILERICSNPTYTATASKLAVVMLAHSDDFAKGVYPSQKQLAEELDVHPSTVQRAVAELAQGFHRACSIELLLQYERCS
jgi:DNA-binding MarR family transcriptional regulator